MGVSADESFSVLQQCGLVSEIVSERHHASRLYITSVHISYGLIMLYSICIYSIRIVYTLPFKSLGSV